MQANLYSNFYRRCQSNALRRILLNVRPSDTAYNAYMVVDLDSLISLQSAGLPYTIDNDGNYVFQLGDVPPLQCNILQMTVFISCDAEIGQTLCNSVTIFPSDPCSGTWTGPEVVATARCNGDKVDLAIWNQGSENMSAPLNFIVIEDFIMYKDGPFQNLQRAIPSPSRYPPTALPGAWKPNKRTVSPGRALSRQPSKAAAD